MRRPCPHPVKTDPPPAPDAGPYIRFEFKKPPRAGLVVLLTAYEWSRGELPTEKVLAARFREIGEGETKAPPMPALDPQRIALRAAAPHRGKVAQESTAELPLFGTGTLL